MSRNLIGLSVVAWSLFALIGCEKCSGGVPPPDDDRDLRACVIAQTGQVDFTNRSSTSTYDVIWGGRNVGTIGPGDTITETSSAGTHSLDFRFAGTTQSACTPDTASVVACSTRSIACDSERCEVFNTGKLSFENRSASGASYDVFLDGALMVRLDPGEESESFELPVKSYLLEFRFAGTSNAACNPFTVSVQRCGDRNWSCSN